jgi:hypothetical protein
MPTHTRNEVHGLTKATELLIQYSRRKLRYNSDALNAIMAVLSHLQSGADCVSSIWGVPFARIKTTRDQRVLCIFWHIDPTIDDLASRRPEFPSWSPLGWDGSVRFLDPADQYYITKEQATKLRVKSESLLRAKDPQNSSKLLEITACIFQASIAHTIDAILPPAEPFLIFPIINGANQVDMEYSMYLRIQWDSRDLNLSDTSAALCAITPKKDLMAQGMVIILKPCIGYYERIGSARYRNAIKAKSLNDLTQGTKMLTWDYREGRYSMEAINKAMNKLCEGKERTIVLG